MRGMEKNKKNEKEKKQTCGNRKKTKKQKKKTCREIYINII